KGALDRFGRPPIAPAEVVGTSDDQVLGDVRQEVPREVPRGRFVVGRSQRDRIRSGRESRDVVRADPNQQLDEARHATDYHERVPESATVDEASDEARRGLL